MNINIFRRAGLQKHFVSYTLSWKSTKGYAPPKQGSKSRKRKAWDPGNGQNQPRTAMKENSRVATIQQV